MLLLLLILLSLLLLLFLFLLLLPPLLLVLSLLPLLLLLLLLFLLLLLLLLRLLLLLLLLLLRLQFPLFPPPVVNGRYHLMRMCGMPQLIQTAQDKCYEIKVIIDLVSPPKKSSLILREKSFWIIFICQTFYLSARHNFPLSKNLVLN